jgi:hypothetical protein
MEIQRMVWYDFDVATNKEVRKILLLTRDMKIILSDIWDSGVFYINCRIDYGLPNCDIAIEKAKRLEPPQFINYRTIRVSRYLRPQCFNLGISTTGKTEAGIYSNR